MAGGGGGESPQGEARGGPRGEGGVHAAARVCQSFKPNASDQVCCCRNCRLQANPPPRPLSVRSSDGGEDNVSPSGAKRPDSGEQDLGSANPSPRQPQRDALWSTHTLERGSAGEGPQHGRTLPADQPQMPLMPLPSARRQTQGGTWDSVYTSCPERPVQRCGGGPPGGGGGGQVSAAPGARASSGVMKVCRRDTWQRVTPPRRR